MSPRTAIDKSVQVISHSTPVALALVVSILGGAITVTWKMARTDNRVDINAINIQAAKDELGKNGAKIEKVTDSVADLTQQVTKLAGLIDGIAKRLDDRGG